jgi:hypothetical protein
MKLFGLTITADRTALPCTIGLWLVLSLGALLLFRLSVMDALLAGLAATAIHWFSSMWHDLGHVIAARRIGHPMIGLRLWTIFAINVYPPDEGDLPAKVHVQRALGGPIASAVLTVVFGVLVLAAVQGTAWWWLMFFGFLDNLFVMTLQAFAPLGFNDGATLWKWTPRLRT